MKITRLDVHNFCGVRRVSLDVCEPLIVIGGANGSGKSSLAEGIRLALTGEGARVVKPSEFAKLVTDGSKGSMVYVRVEHDEGRTGRQVTMPDGNAVQEGPPLPGPEYLPFVADPTRFARSSADYRRMLLFGLLDVRTSPEAVERMLTERGVSPERAAEAASMMRSGFPAACEYATEQAKAARASWRALTGEVYGARKAETWRSLEVGFDAARLDAVLARLETVVPDLDAAQREVGAIEARQRMAERSAKTIADLREKVSKQSEIEIKLADDMALLARVDAAYQASHAVPCPHCGAFVTIRLDKLEPYEGAQPTEEQLRTVEHYTLQARGAVVASITDGKRKLIEIEQAKKTLAETEAYEAVSGGAVERARERAAALRREADSLLTERRELERAQGQALEAEKRTEAAAAYHGDVAEWSSVVDLLAPDGIPSELLQDVLGRMNATLREYAHMSGFMQVTLTHDLEITANSRPYALLSKSERWRVDAMLAVAIAHYSGLRFVMLDEFDVLDAVFRQEMLDWLEHLFQHHMLEAVIVFATLRNAPADEPGFMQCHWISGGMTEIAMREAV